MTSTPVSENNKCNEELVPHLTCLETADSDWVTSPVSIYSLADKTIDWHMGTAKCRAMLNSMSTKIHMESSEIINEKHYADDLWR